MRHRVFTGTLPAAGRPGDGSLVPDEIRSMGDVTIGLLHPGEMGAAVGRCLTAAGHEVLWVPEGRSEATRKRAAEAGLDGCGWAEMAARSDVIVSICPP